ncbi:MAG: TRAP transporter small permease subunit [Dehalococcoidales bacterium]|nr:TRAP transporter small permease subunit [Dehalococcoidales bacterium]
MQKLKTALSWIDKLSDVSGKIIALMIAPIVLIIVFEVVMRYVFDKPTVWVNELSWYLFGALFAIGGAYGMLHGSHVNVEIFQMRLPRRARAALDIFTGLLTFLFIGILLIWGWRLFMSSFAVLEKSHTTWAPPVYPMKFIVPFSAFLMILQAIAKFTRDIHTAVTGKETL